ncbi:hypothetical protein Tsubulata_024993 [Turnera subulata]|uniref:DUF4283 domain-containing protein n=1 Tax=Turnera subulata TaxID=218843 RepID=A0A9Q0JBA7_9ROSI|nr:hypothetical protein Tsubulata_024993 [Turnera subulata]
MGQEIGYRTLCSRLPSLWNLKQSVRMVDLENNFYFVRFQSRYDYLWALTDGPWIVLGHYLTVEPWKPQFNPASHKVSSIVAWVQIPGLSCEYYDRRLLQVVCNELGCLVRLDHNTKEALRGRYARVAVELDLMKPLQSQVLVDDTWYLISCENIPDICFEYGLVGHLMPGFLSRTQANTRPEGQHTSPTAAPDAHSGILMADQPEPQAVQVVNRQPRGEWMIAGRKRRPPRSGGGQQNKETEPGKETINSHKSGSRFDVLQDYITVERPTTTEKGKAVISPSQPAVVLETNPKSLDPPPPPPPNQKPPTL